MVDSKITIDKPPREKTGPVNWVISNLLTPWWNVILSVITLAMCFFAVQSFYSWAVKSAAFGSTPESCEGIDGACWSFVADSIWLFLVGLYPAEERWRPILCFLLLLLFVSTSYSFRNLLKIRSIVLLAISGAIACGFLLYGHEWIGLSVVPTSKWGGLLLTLVLSIVGIAFAFPIGIILALGRRSPNMPAVHVMCVGFIEFIRGVPLISILFLTSILVPLFLPDGLEVDILIRAQIGIILFQAGYLAEVVRGGFQGLPTGQEEAAKSLGLNYWYTVIFITLPQALKIALPSITNQFIIIVKDTSLVSIVGLFDLLGMAELSIRNPKWLGTTFEAYIVVGLLYWILCFFISHLSLKLEEHLKKDHT